MARTLPKRVVFKGTRFEFSLNPDASNELFKYGVVDVEFKRVPCRYAPGYNILLKVHEHSKKPEYLAVVILYAAGQKDITAVEFWQEDCQEWRPMRRAFGAVFDTPNPPATEINLRFEVSSSGGGRYWVEARNPIPSDWEVGAAYDSEVHARAHRMNFQGSVAH